MKTWKKALVMGCAVLVGSQMMGQQIQFNLEEPFIPEDLRLFANPQINQTDEISISTPATMAKFGYAVAVSGDGKEVFVGSPANGGSNDGKVHMYRQQADSTWKLVKIFHPSISTAFFGASLACSKDAKTLVVGAPRSGNSERGCFFVFNRSNGVWNEAKYGAPGKYVMHLGTSVACSENGDIIAVGAAGDYYDSGSIRVYSKTSDGYRHDAKLLPAGMIGPGTTNQRLGASVAISKCGGVIVGGAPGSDGKWYNSGAAYVFVYDGATKKWLSFQKIIAADGYKDDEFGASVDISGPFIVVGAPQHNLATPNTWTGAVYIHEWDSVTPNKWGMTKKLKNQNSDSHFGCSVSMFYDEVSNNGRLVVGDFDLSIDYNRNGIIENGEYGIGAVSLYHFNDVAYWEKFEFMTSQDVGGKAEKKFGAAVAVSENGLTYVVGTPGEESTKKETAYILQGQ